MNSQPVEEVRQTQGNQGLDSNQGQISNQGQGSNMDNLGNQGQINNQGQGSNMDNLGNLGNLGNNMGNIGNMDNMGNFGSEGIEGNLEKEGNILSENDKKSFNIDAEIPSRGSHRINELDMGDRALRTALIVVNVQNCFFKGGSFSFVPSENEGDDIQKEKDLIRKLNSLITLNEEDIDYFNAGLAGSPIYTGVINRKKDYQSGLEILNGTYPSGSRKKYFFDNIIYTQTAYPPDHHAFASHHYLREKKKKLKEMMITQDISYSKAREKITDDILDKHYWSFVDSNFENKGMLQSIKDETGKDEKLWCDHALIDGSDIIIENQRCYRGIEFHPKLNLNPLYRPNININPQVYINKPNIDGRGRIIWLEGNQKASPKSAFKNSLGQSTGLAEYLKENKIDSIYVVGVFRDIMVEATLLDAVEYGFKSINLIYDVSLPFGMPNNVTKVNNQYYFKNIEEINRYLDITNIGGDTSKYMEYLRENNQWVLTLEQKGINVLNYWNIVENLNVAKEEFSCGLEGTSLLKNFDTYLLTSSKTSRDKTMF